MSSVDLYRSLILDPRHGVPGASGTIGAGLPNATITTFLELAASLHSASQWGGVFAVGMVFWAAHRIERTPGLLAGNAAASEVGPVMMRKDADRQRQYGPVAGQATASQADADLMTTSYGLQYLALRSQLARVRAPLVPRSA